MARSKKEGSYHFLNVRINDEILDKLNAYAEQSRIPKNAITEMALLEYLKDKVSDNG